MKQRYFIFLLVLLTLIIACNGEQRATPTPFAEETPAEETRDPETSLPISITDLAAAPEEYNNDFIEVSGRYRRLPLLVCNSDPYPAPATWQLQAKDGSLIDVGGFDSQVRSLLPNDLTMTVTGVWQLFEGPVGCGKNAASSQIWYLKVSDILSPSPIAQVTLTPTGDVTQIAAVDGLTAVPTPTNDDDPVAATPTLQATKMNPVAHLRLPAPRFLPRQAVQQRLRPFPQPAVPGMRMTSPPPHLPQPAAKETPPPRLPAAMERHHLRLAAVRQRLPAATVGAATQPPRQLRSPPPPAIPTILIPLN